MAEAPWAAQEARQHHQYRDRCSRGMVRYTWCWGQGQGVVAGGTIARVVGAAARLAGSAGGPAAVGQEQGRGRDIKDQ